jgi:hypothetical protein
MRLIQTIERGVAPASADCNGVSVMADAEQTETR